MSEDFIYTNDGGDGMANDEFTRLTRRIAGLLPPGGSAVDAEVRLQWWFACLGIRGPRRDTTGDWCGRPRFTFNEHLSARAADAIAAEVVEATHPANRANGLKPGDVLFTRTAARSELAFRGPDALTKFVRFALSADELPA